MRGLLAYLACCFLPAALYATQPNRFVGLALVGLFAALVPLMLRRERGES